MTATLFVLPPTNQLCCAKSGEAGREERQAEWLGHIAHGGAGVGLYRQDQACHEKEEDWT